MRPEIVKMTSGKAYRVDGYDGFTLTAVHVGAFSAVLEGQVQTNLETTPIEAEWIPLQTLVTQGLYAFDTTTPFLRVRVLSGAPVIHLQKYEVFTLAGQVINSPSGVGFWNSTEKQYYVFDNTDTLFYPSTPTATTALRGAVNKGASRVATVPASATLTAGAAYTQAEITAIITRLEQVRARLADLEAKMITAGQLT